MTRSREAHGEGAGALDVLFRDERFVAVNKPPGLLVHRSRIDRGADRFALQTVRDQIGQRVFPVHRLDKPTSGVLLFALDPEAARRLSDAFARRAVRKTYLAVVRGYLEPGGVIDYALRETRDRTTDGRARRDKPAQPAVTVYRRLATVETPHAVGRYPTSRYALAAVRPRTGRKHQIRRHMKHLFHPVIGDRKYGDRRHNRFFEEHLGCRRMLLHAAALAFRHPFTGAPTVVLAPLDGAFRDVLERLGWGGLL
ncbi:tRNA pseudouridine(65) synthase TruC [Rhodocaloribacter sp.]